jgi:DNA-directed RNA polymerase subunit E'/Rpb7
MTQIFVNKVETQSREKPLWGSQTQEFHYLGDKVRYKIVTLTCTDAVVVP